MSIYLVTADALLLVHALFVLFVVAGLVLVLVGGPCQWDWVKNPWFRLSHLAAITFVVLQSWAGQVCPLTTWELTLRASAGQEGYESSFISYWVGRLLYYNAPDWLFVLCYSAFGALVIASWWWVPPHRFKR